MYRSQIIFSKNLLPEINVLNPEETGSYVLEFLILGFPTMGATRLQGTALGTGYGGSARGRHYKQCSTALNEASMQFLICKANARV